MTPETFVDASGAQVTLIHFSDENGKLACMPNLKELHATSGPNAQRLAPHMRTGEPGDGVTCPTCRKSQAFMGAAANLRAAIARAKR